MGLLYVNENGAQIGYEANKCVVNYKDGLKKLIPIESLEGITIMGQSQMTAKCTEECLKRGIPVVIFFKRWGILWSCNVYKPYKRWKTKNAKCTI